MPVSTAKAIESNQNFRRGLSVCLRVTLALLIAHVAVCGSLRRWDATLILSMQGLCFMLAKLWTDHGKIERAIRLIVASLLISSTLMTATLKSGIYGAQMLVFPALLGIASVLLAEHFSVYAGITTTLVSVLGIADWQRWIGEHPAMPVDLEHLAGLITVMVAAAVASGQLARAASRTLTEASDSTQRLQFQLARMPLGYIRWDRDLKVCEWNREAERIFGYRPEEVIGQNGISLLVRSQDAKQMRTVWKDIISGDDSNYCTGTALHKDGHELKCEWFSAPLRDELGRVIGAQSMVCDVTSQREKEKQFELLWDSSRDAMRLTDYTGRIVRVNRAFCELVRLPQEQLEGVLFTEALGEHSRQSRIARYRERVRLGTIESRMEREITLWDGRRVWVELSNSVLDSPRGPLILSIFRDRTEGKRVEEQLNRALAAAKEASQAKSEFLANVSHEIRTPLNAVIGMTTLVLEGPLGDEQRNYVEIVRSSGQALLALLNDILDLSKIEAGRLEVHQIDFQPRKVVAEVVEPIAVTGMLKGLPVVADIAASVPEWIKGDPGRFRQVLINLLSNAVKFTASGIVRLNLQCCQEDGRLFLSGAVMDTGIGIPASQQEMIFDAFAQADGSTTRRYGGTGLGLTITRQLLQLMGGAITVESTPGVGSTFRFRLEVCRTNPAPRQEEPRTAGKVRPMRILLAEDNAVNQMLVLRMLEKSGHSVCVVPNGREAVERSSQERFDAILMDVQMPEMDGLEATRQIREREQSGATPTCIIALTAHAMRGDEETCRRAGMNDYVAKPIDPQALAGALLRLSESLDREDRFKPVSSESPDPATLCSI